MSLQDQVKTEAQAVETKVAAEAKGLLAKTVSVKVLVIVAAAAFVLGILVHLL